MSLIEELRSARWFGGKDRAIRDARVIDRADWVDNSSICLVEVEYGDGMPEVYVLADRLADPPVGQALLERFAGSDIPTKRGGVLQFQPTHLFKSIPHHRTMPPGLMRGEQSNTSIRFGDALILKLFRRVQFGPNPDVEVGWFLTEHTEFRGTPAVVGSLEYESPGRQTASLAMLQEFEPNRGDAWSTTLQRLQRVLAGGDTTDSIEAMARLGETTARLHLALASGTESDFSAEPISDTDIGNWRNAILDEVHAAAEALSRRRIGVDASELVRRADGIEALRGSLKTRHHGDYHLGQVLEREDGSFVIIDFEGEPSKPLAKRREKRSPLRDVAGMLRSLDYARNAALRAGDADDPVRLRRASSWHAVVRDAFLSAYLGVIRQTMPALLPDEVPAPLAALELEKAAYEILYELNNRPDWLPIPLAALTSA